jgi:hypothetical protein
MFEYIDEGIKLSLMKNKVMDDGIVWMTFALDA